MLINTTGIVLLFISLAFVFFTVTFTTCTAVSVCVKS